MSQQHHEQITQLDYYFKEELVWYLIPCNGASIYYTQHYTERYMKLIKEFMLYCYEKACKLIKGQL